MLCKSHYTSLGRGGSDSAEADSTVKAQDEDDEGDGGEDQDINDYYGNHGVMNDVSL